MKYRRVFTSDMKRLIYERPEKLRAGIVRAPFPMKNLAQVLNCNLNAVINHEIILYKLLQNNNPMESSFVVQLITKMRGILYAVLFYGVNAIGKLLSNMLDMTIFGGYERESAALRRARVQTVDKIVLIDYLAPESC